MELQNLISFLLVGAIAGWIGGQIMKGSGFGLIGNIVVGIVGSVLGGWLFDFLQIETPNNFMGAIVTAVGGAIVLLWVAKMMNAKK